MPSQALRLLPSRVAYLCDGTPASRSADAQILARHADPRTTEHYDRACGNLDRHGVHFLTVYVAGV